MSEKQIRDEYNRSKDYELTEIKTKDGEHTLVDLTFENVAKVEAMIRTDSNYRITDLNDKEQSPYWIIEMGKHLTGDKDKIREPDFDEVIKNVVEKLDKENGTRLTTDCSKENSENNARKVMEKRIKKYKNDILSYLKEPNNCKIDFIRILSEQTPDPLNGRCHRSFASKFCHYACFYIFNGDACQDKFSIYDKFILEALPHYMKLYGINDIKINEFNYYKTFQAAIDKVIEKSGANISRNGFDHLLWYYFKGDRLKKEKSLKKYQNNDTQGK